MQKIIFFCALIYNGSLVSYGSNVNPQMPNFNSSNVDCSEPKNAFYNERNLNQDDDEYFFIDLLIDYANILVNIEKAELEADIKVWFENRLDVLSQIQDFNEYEIYKKALQEDLEWYALIYPELQALSSLKNFLENL